MPSSSCTTCSALEQSRSDTRGAFGFDFVDETQLDEFKDLLTERAKLGRLQDSLCKESQKELDIHVAKCAEATDAFKYELVSILQAERISRETARSVKLADGTNDLLIAEEKYVRSATGAHKDAVYAAPPCVLAVVQSLRKSKASEATIVDAVAAMFEMPPAPNGHSRL